MSPTPPTEERLARQWAAIATRTARPRRARWPWLAGALVACAAGALFVIRERHEPAPLAQPAPLVEQSLSLETTPGASVLSLGEGVRVRLGDDARISVGHHERAIVVDLVQGTAHFDVEHDPARAFVVRAGDVRVEDMGTRFSVERHGAVVTVSVADGSVRVRRGADAFSDLHAGETWSIGAPAAATEQARPDERDASSVPSARSPDDEAFATFKSLAAVHREGEAYAALGDDGFARATERASASDLFLLGDVARLTGHTREAAHAYDTLRKRHRASEHAALASFELGRMRLDTLHDAPGAAEAFADAIELSPAAPFREDAEARRVEALDLAGDVDGCARARQAYLARYPHGLYESRVDARCKPR